MAKLSDLATTDKIKVLLYGASGAGKTVFAASSPGPVYFFDFDGKISSAKKYLEVENKGKIGEIEFEQFPINQAANNFPYLKFQKLLSDMETLVAKGDFKYKSVVVDSLTLYSDALMQQVIRNNPGVKRFVAGIPVLQDYMIHSSMFKQDMNRLLSLPCNVICVGHITTEKDEASGRMISKPLLSGKLADHLPRIFFEVWRAYVDPKDGLHKAQTRSDGNFTCRTEIPKIPATVKLEYKSILEYMNKT